MSKRPLRREGRPAAAPVAQHPEVVDPVWLMKAFGLIVAVALVCGYLTLCALFYRGQWQLVLHPERTSAAPATVGGVPFQVVRFGAGGTGVPQLTGWWIPGPQASSSDRVLLYLPGGDGSLAREQARLAALHDTGLSIFAIDYRGYGESAELHPGERSMREDTQTALEYLRSSRGIAAARVIPYGVGVGAALALDLATSSTGVPAVILDQPDAHVEQRVAADPRSGFIPVRLLFHDRFALLPAIDESRIPKLILFRGDREDPALAKAADPKRTVLLPASPAGGDTRAVTRFLDEYAPAAPGLVPTPAPSPPKTP